MACIGFLVRWEYSYYLSKSIPVSSEADVHISFVQGVHHTLAKKDV